jgi:hypothetical protein
MNNLLDSMEIQTELSNSLLLFYIALTSNFLVNFFPKTHIDFIKNNIFAKHLLGFFTMLFSIYHITTISDLTQILLVTLFLYLWFLMTTRLPPIYNILIIVFLSLIFLINIKIDHLQKNNNKNVKNEIFMLSKMAKNIFTFIMIFIVLIYIYYLY